MKTIYLARHAKSSWNTEVTSDFERALNERGKADSIKMAEELRRLMWLPEKIIASPAVRVKQTCKAYCEILEYPLGEVEWNSDIYEAYAVTLLQVLANLDEGIQSVMLIGHNPSLEDVLMNLCGRSALKEHSQVNGKIFTTANIAKLITNSPWKDLITDDVLLDEILRPKEL